MESGGIVCLESGWCDYSDEHRQVREEAERYVEAYIRGGESEYWMTVVVAPYGSGKTTLLRHLRYYADRLGAGAALVEFADIVNYIVEKYGTVHESQLPRIVEDYVRSRFNADGDNVFVLLIDEIEESYDLFRGIVEHETSPLRGLAEAVRTRATWVYPVLAFGPSSTLKEAVFGPVAWRSRVLTIPLIPKPVIVSLLAEEGVDENHRELLANMVWWASKGRAAWVKMLVTQVVPRLLEAARGGPEALEAFLLSDEALAREMLEGVPLFDRSGYRDVKRFVENKAMLPYLASFVGPAPSSLLESYLGEPPVPEAGPVYGFTRSFIDADELVAETTAWMERVARSRGVTSSSIDHAVSALEHVVSAWSRQGRLPFDMQSLRDIFAIAADLAREMYGDDPAAAQLLESMNPDLVAPEARRGNEAAVYLRPAMLTRLYPSATNNPLLGCAKKAGIMQVVDVVESLSPDEVIDYSGHVARLLGLEEALTSHGVRLLVAPLRLLPSLRGRICSAKTVVVVADARSSEAGKEQLPSWLRSLEKAGVVAVAAAGPRLSLFLYSLFYNYALGTQSCSPDRLDSHGRRILALYGDSLKSLTLEALHRLLSPQLLEAERALERLAAAYGEEGGAAVVRLALADENTRRRVASIYGELRDTAIRLASIMGAAAPSLPDIVDAADEVAKLPALEALEALPEDCRAALPGPLRAAALNGRSHVARLPGLLKKLHAAASVARGGVLEAVAAEAARLEQLLGELWRYEPLAAAFVEKKLWGFVEAATGRVQEIAARLEALRANAASLPGEVARKALEAIEEDVARVGSVDELLGYIGLAEAALAELSKHAAATPARRELEELKRRIASLAESIIRVAGGAQPAHSQALTAA